MMTNYLMVETLDNGIPLDTPILMVDEFQDVSRLLYETFVHLTKGLDYVIIVGDPNQSIYGYKGGSPEFLIQYDAPENILGYSHRFPQPIWNLAKKILKRESQEVPESITARDGNDLCIRHLNNGGNLPTHETELHLVRCNYQKWPVAMALADAGKPFSGDKSYGWTEDEMKLYNIIKRYRAGAVLGGIEYKKLVNIYPMKFFNTSEKRDVLIRQLSAKSFTPQLTWAGGIISNELDMLLRSKNPLSHFADEKKLFQKKIAGALKAGVGYLTPAEIGKRRLMTIHAAKGAEAIGNFLHTEIPPVVNRGLLIPGKASQAEARVWYVGVTRAIENLYVIRDNGFNYKIPGATVC